MQRPPAAWQLTQSVNVMGHTVPVFKGIASHKQRLPYNPEPHTVTEWTSYRTKAKMDVIPCHNSVKLTRARNERQTVPKMAVIACHNRRPHRAKINVTRYHNGCHKPHRSSRHTPDCSRWLEQEKIREKTPKGRKPASLRPQQAALLCSTRVAIYTPPHPPRPLAPSSSRPVAYISLPCPCRHGKTSTPYPMRGCRGCVSFVSAKKGGNEVDTMMLAHTSVAL